MLYRLYTILFLITFFLLSGCTSSDQQTVQSETNETNVNLSQTTVPDKIILLFVTQEECPSCDKLEATMMLPKPQALLENYFEIQEIDFNTALPNNLPPPFGTPTVYFLGYNSEILIEPMIGEKNERQLLEFLRDAMNKFKVVYGVDLEHKEKSDETNFSQNDP